MYSTTSGQGQVEGYCEYCKEFSDCTIRRELPDYMRNYQLEKKVRSNSLYLKCISNSKRISFAQFYPHVCQHHYSVFLTYSGIFEIQPCVSQIVNALMCIVAASRRAFTLLMQQRNVCSTVIRQHATEICRRSCRTSTAKRVFHVLSQE